MLAASYLKGEDASEANRKVWSNLKTDQKSTVEQSVQGVHFTQLIFQPCLSVSSTWGVLLPNLFCKFLGAGTVFLLPVHTIEGTNKS